jgi:hypothetical protein
LGKEPLDALPHLIALGAQRANFGFHLIDDGRLFGDLGFGFHSTLFGRGAGLALALDELDRAYDALFKC